MVRNTPKNAEPTANAKAAIKLATCLVLDAFAFLLPGVVATITAMHVIRKDKNKFRKQVRKPMPKR